jgi:hypothetical protein
VLCIESGSKQAKMVPKKERMKKYFMFKELSGVLKAFLRSLTSFCVIFFLMERVDQGHLDPKLEVPRLTCLGR